MCMFCRSFVCPVVLFLLAIVLSVLRYTDSDYPFGIFKFFLQKIIIKVPVQSQEYERSCMYVRGIDVCLCFYGFLVDFLEISHSVVLLAVYILLCIHGTVAVIADNLENSEVIRNFFLFGKTPHT